MTKIIIVIIAGLFSVLTITNIANEEKEVTETEDSYPVAQSVEEDSTEEVNEPFASPSRTLDLSNQGFIKTPTMF